MQWVRGVYSFFLNLNLEHGGCIFGNVAFQDYLDPIYGRAFEVEGVLPFHRVGRLSHML